MSSAVKAAADKVFAKRVLARRRLLHFTTLTHPSYKPGWLHEDICMRLERFSQQVVEEKSPRLMLLCPPRHGKLLAHSTLVPTPVGARTHGELRAGDRVFHPSGAAVKVIAVSEEATAGWEVRTTTGEVVKCHEEHEWTVFDRSRREWRTLTTAYLASQSVFTGERARFQLPLVDALQCPETPLPIDPYFLGVWLGDGKSSDPVICGTPEDMAQHPSYKPGWLHEDICMRLERFSQQVVEEKSPRLTLLCPPRHGKLLAHIPEKYLFAHEYQRRLLLAGLVDTDGSVEPKTQRVRFRTGSERLAGQVAFLVRTLGYRASVDYTPPDTRDRGIVGGASWCVQWTPHDGRGGGTLPRKSVTRLRTRRAVGIAAVTRATTPEKGVCIQVDAPDGLYLVGERLVPTHNSQLASVRFPAWHLGHHPAHEIINVGYNLDLPMTFSRQVRELVRSANYKAMFPDMQLDPNSQSIETWNTLKGGGFLAAGVGGGITGKGAHILIVDDPLKNQEDADNADLRKKLVDWYQSTAYTRLAPGGGVLLIQTCWNDADLAGYLQNMAKTDPDSDQFEVVKYPALSEAWEYRDNETLDIVRSDKELPPDPKRALLRPIDTCLHEARYPTHALKRIKNSGMATRIWSALYQQNPVPDEGVFFAKKDFRYTSQLPEPYGMRVYTAWDFAIGEKKQNDYTVGMTVLQDEHNRMYVLNVRRFRGTSFEIVEAMLDEAAIYAGMYNVDYLIGVEDGQIWKAMKPYFELRMQERKEYPSYEILSPYTDKLARARPLQGRLQQGLVYWPDPGTHPWVNQAVTEMLRFPAGANDDVVDAAAWAARMCAMHSPPQTAAPPKVKSWRDRLNQLESGGATAMSA